jgi:hypothetical protein
MHGNHIIRGAKPTTLGEFALYKEHAKLHKCSLPATLSTNKMWQSDSRVVVFINSE